MSKLSRITAMAAATVAAVGTAALLACSDQPTAPPSRTARSPLAASTRRVGDGSADAHLLVTGLHRARGSAVGPDGALYVTESEVGRISRVDPEDGTVTTFASGLPTSPLGAGGVVDVAFVEGTAYALVTIVGSNFVAPLAGDATSVGIYRVDGPSSFTLVADIGKFSAAHLPPPDFPIGLKTGVQFALQPFRDGFLVTDGHHNRVLRVAPDGEITTLLQLGNIVPTGLAVRGNTVYMTETGPVPHLPADGKVITFSFDSPTPSEVARGAPLMVDVEFGRGNTLFALSQGTGSGGPPATPAVPNTGALVRVDDGAFTAIKSGLDRPTSLKFIGNTAYVVTLAGEVWKIQDVAGVPFNDEIILRDVTGAGGFGHVKFRQPKDDARIVYLDTWVRDLEPNTSYQLQRATDTNVNDDCTGTNWLTLGKGAVPQSITTDDGGTGREELFRDLSAIPVGSTFDIHFRVINQASHAVVLESDCYQYVVRQ